MGTYCVSLSFPWISTLYPPCEQLLTVAVGGAGWHGCWGIVFVVAALASPCLSVFVGCQCWPSIVSHHSSPAQVVLCPILTFCPQLLSLALSCWPHCCIIPIPAVQLGVLWWWWSLSLSSPPCCCLPYPIIVILALVSVPLLPLHGPLCHPPFHHLLTISSSSYSLLLSLSSICFQGCDVAGVLT